MFEAPIRAEGPPRLDIRLDETLVRVARPHVPAGLEDEECEGILRQLLDKLVDRHCLHSCIVWYCSPAVLGFSRHLAPEVAVYDCPAPVDALAGPARLHEQESELLRRADLVFLTCHSRREAGLERHPAVHVFPDCVDVTEFERARSGLPDPPEQSVIPRPRLGCLDALDAPLDVDLLAAVADARPDWHIVVIGAGGERRAGLARRANVHDLGPRPWHEIPAYVASWDVAILPCSPGDGVHLDSGARLLQYLAAGRPVVATATGDGVHPAGVAGLVAVADAPADFIIAVECELQRRQRRRWRCEVDALLARSSWDATWQRMQALIEGVIR